jgi:BirA family biotin operon repressor/biotin-[acetyl-CoA-carboxylase] ligase
MRAWPAGTGREIHDSLDSSQAEALRRAASGEAGPVWIMARRQSAGRGRRGRAWATGEGNFAASLLFAPPGGLAQAALRSFVAALALRDALVELGAPSGAFSLKWPNDVLLHGAKLAGILLETAGPPLRLVIGFGVNLASAPAPSSLEETAMPAIALTAVTGRPLPPEALLDALAPAFARWEARLVREGFAPVRDAWLADAAGLGAPVSARLPGTTITGRFETIDATGAIVLSTASGRLALPAADIHFAAGDPADPPAPPGPDQPPADPGPGDPDMPPEPGEPPSPDIPPEEPPVIDPPAPDMPTENPPVSDPPAPDTPGEVPPPPPTELPPGGPQEIPTQVSRAACD